MPPFSDNTLKHNQLYFISKYQAMVKLISIHLTLTLYKEMAEMKIAPS